MKRRSAYLIVFMLAFIIGCKSSTEPPAEESAGVYLPMPQGSEWVYLFAGSDTLVRFALDTQIFGGVSYQLLRDSIPYSAFDTAGNRYQTFVFDSQYVRNDLKNIYQLASTSPVSETIQLEKTVGSKWTYFDTISKSPLALQENDYTTLALLPVFAVGDSTYHDVLQLQIIQFDPKKPNSKPPPIMDYFAKGVGQVAVTDSAGTKFSLKLLWYHLK
ncbi:MAG TPA: hypothetical protein VEW28_10735 [Candidatus Kapabacteria bacterium]|nr:hypothetical protein [Candidatus Kapabacteria bacterium]